MASAVDSRLAYARLSAVATASRLPTANRGSNNSYTTSWDMTKLVHPGGAKLVHLMLCGTRSEAAREVPVGPPGQPLHRRLSRYFWGFPPFLALVETIALAVHFQDMDMVGEAVQQSPGQAFRAEYLRPLIERQVGGHQDRAPLVALAEDFEQQLGAGLRERHEAEFVDDQKVILCQLLLQAQQAFFIPGLHQC